MSTTPPSLMDTLFQGTLDDLIKSLRNPQCPSVSPLISQSAQSSLRELQSQDPLTQSTALQKLSYLSSLHGLSHPVPPLPVLQSLSSRHYPTKSIGYHAAITLKSSSELILLLTHQLRKDLTALHSPETALALHFIAQAGTPDLCRDLTPEIVSLLSKGNKKAIAVFVTVLDKYPDAVRVSFKKLVEGLGDEATLVTVIGVFCELVKKDVRAYLPLAPEFYKVLVESRDNWVLIKVVKIFGRLVGVEPRLGRKVGGAVEEVMRRTGAVSLGFECVRTVFGCPVEFGDAVVRVAVEKNREFLRSEDPNLRSLGLQALSILAEKGRELAWAVLESKEVVFSSLSSSDPNIRVGALRLLVAIVSEGNLVEICRVLVNFAVKSDPEFCNEILGAVLETCGKGVYEVVVDFDWYVTVLGDMARIAHCRKGEEIERQLVDIGMRVMDARPQLVRVSRDLLIDPALLGNPYIHSVLSAAAWLSGEYPEFSKHPYELIESLIQPRTSLLPPSIRAIYIQSCFKILTFCVHFYFMHMESELSISLSDGGTKEGSSMIEEISSSASIGNFGLTKDLITKMFSVVELALGPLYGSKDIEVRERVRNVLGLIDLVKCNFVDVSDLMPAETQESEAFRITKFIYDAFVEELGPVSVSAQEKVLVPDGLNPINNLNDLDLICGDVQLPSLNLASLGGTEYGDSSFGSLPDLQSKEDAEPPLSGSTSLLAEHRKRHGLYYLLSEKTENGTSDYPPANDLTSHSVKLGDDSEDLLKLASQSLVPKKKSSQGRLRPVVVKLDGDDTYVSTKKPEQKDDESLSGAIREALSGKEVATSSMQLDVHPKSAEDLAGEERSSKKKSGAGRRKDHAHRKEKRHRKPVKSGGEEDEENGSKGKQKSRHHRRSQRSRAREDGSSAAAAQTSVIPDFLL